MIITVIGQKSNKHQMCCLVPGRNIKRINTHQHIHGKRKSFIFLSLPCRLSFWSGVTVLDFLKSHWALANGCGWCYNINWTPEQNTIYPDCHSGCVAKLYSLVNLLRFCCLLLSLASISSFQFIQCGVCHIYLTNLYVLIFKYYGALNTGN